ncbi:MAG: ABC transporter permease [Phreatobacter sp.]|uniref:ABC transporter permease n=1 Tax=Phreatobacter sp. TaxID=1966341 RepID=UPI00273409E1|nr:ABC transporter permease [Phreatobacter sp.]MDP2803035.1 ABC transporter permease [Phreatobacter sp.]
MNLALRDIRHNAGRFLLTCLGLSLLLGVVLSMIGIYRGLVADALGIARAPAAALWVVEAKSRGPFAEASRIPGDTREAVARIAGVEAAGSVTYQSVEARHRANPLRLYVIGFEPGRPGGPRVLAEGRQITRPRFEMIADKRSGLTLGDVVSMGRSQFRIVGLTTGQVASGGDPVVYVTLRDAQRLQFDLAPAAQRREQARGATPGSSDIVNAVVATLIPNASGTIVAETMRRWKHLNALDQVEQEAILTRSVVEMARRQIGLFTSILLVVSAVIIALIIYTLTIDKLREIATLKLIGAPDRVIVGLIVQQAIAMGVIGFAFGVLLILAIKDHFPRRVVIEPTDVGILALIVLTVCLVASSLGVRLALKVDAAKALGG